MKNIVFLYIIQFTSVFNFLSSISSLHHLLLYDVIIDVMGCGVVSSPIPVW